MRPESAALAPGIGKTGTPAAMAAWASLDAGVGDAGSARVRNDGDARAGFEFGDELLGAAGFVEEVVADGGRAEVEVVEQLLGLARVFAGDAVCLAQDAQGTQGDVFEVADGRGDEVEAGERLVFSSTLTVSPIWTGGAKLERWRISFI